MNMFATVGVVLGIVAMTPESAWADPQKQRRDDQDAAYAATREGRMMPLREIESRVVPTMRGARYIGFDFDSDRGIYTLKFMRESTVIWVDVDGRSGRIIGRSGN